MGGLREKAMYLMNLAKTHANQVDDLKRNVDDWGDTCV
jgi:hypothetical protein